MAIVRVFAGLVMAAAFLGGVVCLTRCSYFSWIAKRGAYPKRVRDLVCRPSWDDYDPQLVFQAFRKSCLSFLGFLACIVLIAVVGKLFFS
ncbi:MAG: hypothetical protein U0836_15915 [Pirellulales bacterium]